MNLTKNILKAGLAAVLAVNGLSACITIDKLNSGRTVDEVRKDAPRLLEGQKLNDFSIPKQGLYLFVKGCDYVISWPGRETTIKTHEYLQRGN